MKFRTRLIAFQLSTILVLATLDGVVVSSFYGKSVPLLESGVVTSASMCVQTLAARLDIGLAAGDLAALKKELTICDYSSAGEQNLAYVAVLDRHGTLLASVGEPTEDRPMPSPTGLVLERRKRSVLAAAPVLFEGMMLGSAVAEFRTEHIHALSQAIGLSGALGAAVALLSAIASVWFAYRLARPLRQMMLFVRQVAKGQLDAALKTGAHDELWELERDLNAMAADLRGSRDETHAAQRKLETTNSELAQALSTIKSTQEELFRAEKLASLGSLVAGVAHELNTPIGTSVTVCSTVQDLARDFERTCSGGSLRRSDLDRFVQAVAQASQLLMRNLHAASTLVGSFKQVAVDQVTAHRRDFDLKSTLQEILLTLQPLFKATPYRIEIEADDGIRMTSYPGPLGQVITNLASNALLHAFDGRTSGVVRLQSRKSDSKTQEIIFEDNGNGIPDDARSRIFDPFFTTKLGRGGSGLGLSIVFSIVTQLLGGTIDVESKLGVGTRFVVKLPLIAP